MKVNYNNKNVEDQFLRHKYENVLDDKLVS